MYLLVYKGSIRIQADSSTPSLPTWLLLPILEEIRGLVSGEVEHEYEEYETGKHMGTYEG